MSDIENAKIRNTFLGKEDHGIPSSMLSLEGDCWGQGFGGHDLRFEGKGVALLMGILDTLRVDSWEKLPGTLVRVRRVNGRICAVGHIVEDRWFCPGDVGFQCVEK